MSEPILTEIKENRVGFLSGLFYAALVLFSMLSFPSIFPQVVGFWLFLYFVQALQEKKASAFPLAIGLVVYGLKGSFIDPISVAFAVVMGLMLVVHFLVNITERGQGIRKSLSLVVTGISVAMMVSHHLGASCSYKIISENPGPIVCLGDSLTAGGYPKHLQKLCKITVVDMGIDGIETKEGLSKLPEIQKLQPSVVVIELGGHDYNNGKSRKEAFDNLDTLIQRLKARDIEVILVEVPRGLVHDPFRGLERELSQKHDLELVSDSVIRTFVFLGPYAPPGIFLSQGTRRSDDGLHPNENGNQAFAKEVKKAIDRILE